MFRPAFTVAALVLMVSELKAQPGTAPPAARDWGAALRMDAQALHDDLASNHPGTVNREDPGFAPRNDVQLRLALERARTANTLPAYYFALSAYVASFDDGHLSFGIFGNGISEVNWPGFLTRYQADGTQIVVTREDVAPVPLGARLLGCDGLSGDSLSERDVGTFVGRWSLLSQRLQNGFMLFLDDGNPYVTRPARCRFTAHGRELHVALVWHHIGNRDLFDRVRQASVQQPRTTSQRTLADGTRWISLPSFNSDPNSDGGRALPALLAALRADRTGLRAAPAIVLDLRGNGGGSSDWSRQIAELIWGRAAVRAGVGHSRVDWRVSAANLASLRETRDRQVAGGALSPEMRHWFDRVTTGMAEALARGESLWREPDEDDEASPVSESESSRHDLRGPVFFITDAICASACLDAVDLWRRLGAVHVGQTTSADTLYMDVRRLNLPSGLGRVVVPMKVYRDRPRGANRPVVPSHVFAGDIGDTAALEHWIASLPERRP